MVSHNTALYGLFYLLELFVLLTWLLHVRKERPSPGTDMGIFCLWYGVSRFASDAPRVNDEPELAMTDPPYLCIAHDLTSARELMPLCKQLEGATDAGMPVGITGAETANDEVAHAVEERGRSINV